MSILRQLELARESYFPPAEEIEEESSGRMAHQPVQYDHMYRFYKEIEPSFWTDNDLNKDLETERFHYEKASKPEKRLWRYVQGFFAVSDFVVGDIIGKKLTNRIKNPDVNIVYQFIGMMENIHMISYSKVIEKAIFDPVEREKVLSSASKIPSISRKVNWISKWCGMENTIHDLDRDSILAIFELVERNNRILEAMYPGQDISIYKSENILKLEEKLLDKIQPLSLLICALAILEGIFFSASFCAVFWFGKRGLFPGSNKANELIRRDEGKHVENGALIYRTLIKYKIPQTLFHDMIREAVEIEADFINDALPENSSEGLPGMNNKLMLRYIKSQADYVLDLFGYEKIYNIRQEDTFEFMTKQSITDTFTDFFRGEEVNYKMHGGADESAKDKDVVFDEDLEEI